MLGINYESSDEDEAVTAKAPQVSLANAYVEGAIATNIELSHAPTIVTRAPEPAPVEEPSIQSGPVNGPTQGPAVTPPPIEESTTDDVPPGSPYTSSRMMIQNLTLPAVPNLNIPASPPGSPPQTSTRKFAQFLELKKKGQHFNQRLETSTVLRDPSHLQRLMDFAGITEEDRYASTLPEGLAVPTVFPGWAYGEELNASQKRIRKAREEDKSKAPRESIDFVPPREKVTAGLQSSRSSSQSSSKRKELEHRSGRDERSSKSRWRSRSRSPKRQRSRSRDRR